MGGFKSIFGVLPEVKAINCCRMAIAPYDGRVGVPILIAFSSLPRLIWQQYFTPNTTEGMSLFALAHQPSKDLQGVYSGVSHAG
jgi:hypothetical protein